MFMIIRVSLLKENKNDVDCFVTGPNSTSVVCFDHFNSRIPFAAGLNRKFDMQLKEQYKGETCNPEHIVLTVKYFFKV